MATDKGEEATASPPAGVQYAYMFEKDKRPTQQLDALLRALAMHIMAEIGDKQEKRLTPPKLGAFYKEVGGDYDSLFKDTPHQSISYVWQITGCQHSLQPTINDFAPPSIPTLTLRGFSRWESLEILLGPDEHAAYIQYAVKHWALKHPETGEIFPPDLPRSVFPSVADAEVDLWHKSCGQRLRIEAAATSSEAASPTFPPEPHFSHVHARKPTHSPDKRQRSFEPEYSEPRLGYVHVPPGRYSGRHPGQRMGTGTGLSPDGLHPVSGHTDERERRRSLSDFQTGPLYNHEPLYKTYSGVRLDSHVKRPPQPRRHSHPRHHSSSESDDEPTGPTMKSSRRRPASPPSSRRAVPPSAPQPPSANSPSFRPHRPEVLPDDPRRRSAHSPRGGSLRDKLQEKVASMLPNGLTQERPRSRRQNSFDEELRPRRSRDQMPPSRLSRSHSDLDSDQPESDSEDERRRRRAREDQRDRERDRYRDRGRPRDGDREADEERESAQARREQRNRLRRPDAQRRTSSHADIDRQRDQPPWDPYDREPRSREERKARERERNRERDRDRRPLSPPMMTIGGNRYQ